ncbi:hypothetical protein HHL21_07505 [Massilia sp. RP-1-19]|uniref:Novel toxin 10 domain-containing protein n=1 Tax=Massilia polaris TaxID=2728846 RepID=A0A848HM08_9BURK|nr:hypothetical protein [Massilia polaris]
MLSPALEKIFKTPPWHATWRSRPFTVRTAVISRGRPGAADVFVTAADDILGLNAAQIAERLTIPSSPTGFRVIEFPTPQSGMASPVFRSAPGFIGGGRTLRGAREFVVPNQSLPLDSIIRTVR